MWFYIWYITVHWQVSVLLDLLSHISAYVVGKEVQYLLRNFQTGNKSSVSPASYPGTISHPGNIRYVTGKMIVNMFFYRQQAHMCKLASKQMKRREINTINE